MNYKKEFPAFQEYEVKNYKGEEEKRLMIYIEGLEEGIEHHIKNNFQDITLRTHATGKSKQIVDLSFIHRFSHCKSLDIGIPLSKKTDISPIYSLDNLIELHAVPSMKIDVSQFINLKILGVNDLDKDTVNYEKLIHLSRLYFSPRTDDLMNLQSLTSIKFLGIFNSRLNSLKGVEKLPVLEEIEIRRAPKLRDMSHLALNNNVSNILIENIKSIKNFSFLRENKSIEVLNLSTPIDSLDFIPEMLNIKDLLFSDVKDGDMSFLFKSKSLEHIYFYPNKRHYTHTLEEVEKEINCKNDKKPQAINTTPSAMSPKS